MSGNLFRLVYVSQASHDMTDPELVALLEQSRRWNRTAQITGALAYCDQRFLQVLEGPEDEVSQLFRRIVLDARNHSQVTIVSAPTDTCLFGDWSMGWLPATDLRLAGFNLKILFSPCSSESVLDQMFGAFRQLGRAH